jgi:hypothetical protein
MIITIIIIIIATIVKKTHCLKMVNWAPKFTAIVVKRRSIRAPKLPHPVDRGIQTHRHKLCDGQPWSALKKKMRTNA